MMTTRGKFVLTILILGMAGLGAYRWWDRLMPAPAGANVVRPAAGPAVAATPAKMRPGAARLAPVRGYVGGEKMGFVQNPELRRILAEKFQLELFADRRGSVEMVTTEPLEGIDFLWPGSLAQSELFRRGNRARKADEILFVSPIVIYSWDLVEAALTKSGIVAVRDGTRYIVDLPRLLDAVVQRRRWSDLGVPELFGSVKVAFTDPAKSNSGGQYLELAGTVLAGGETLGPEELARVAPRLKLMVEGLGYVQSSSGELFNQYLKQGVGAFPLVAAYENQLIEFACANPDFAAQIRQKLRILYPYPTIWSNHPMIALTDQGRRLLEAMKTPEIQSLAWREHGLRNERAVIDPQAATGFTGIPATVTAVIPSPSLEVTERLLAEVLPAKP
jgi:hypothetical protein